MPSEDDYPDIGDVRGRYVLVCHGDDAPEIFADWLSPLVDAYRRLDHVASEYTVWLRPGPRQPPISSDHEFCEYLGIEFEYGKCAGALASGVYQWGWVKVGREKAAQKKGEALLRRLEASLLIIVRKSVTSELAQIDSLDQLLEKTANDRTHLRETILKLQTALQSAQASEDSAKTQLKQAQDSDTTEIDRQCMKVALAKLKSESARVVAGPIVLWDDGTVYFIHQWGTARTSSQSIPAILADGLEAAGHLVVRVIDKSKTRGFLSGPRLIAGPAGPSGWGDAWRAKGPTPRQFFVEPPEYRDKVAEIHQILSGQQV